MKMSHRLIACSALFALAAPLWAAPPDAPPAPSSLPQQSVLDGLVGKHRVIGFTERGGRRFLGRVLSGDHGLYIVQTFHYTTAPMTMTEKTPQTAYLAGRNGRLRRVTRQVKSQVTSQKTIADETAVRALLSGVAGPSFFPSEQPAQREMIAPTDVVCLQELRPPTTAGLPKTAAWTLKTLWASPDLPKPKTAAGQAAPK